MSAIALGLGLGLGLGIPCCCYVVGLSLLFFRKNDHKQAKESASISQTDHWSISPANPMEDFSGSIENAQTQISSILQPIDLETQSSDLNLPSVEPISKREIPNEEFPRSEPLFNTLFEEATSTQDVSIVLPIKIQIPISLLATNETIV